MGSISEEQVLEDEVMDSLEKVMDPELGIDIVNLGLIYNVECHDNACSITMTLTTMGCPISDMLLSEIKKRTTSVDGIYSCEVNLVWDPAWNVSKMSRYARLALGIYST